LDSDKGLVGVGTWFTNIDEQGRELSRSEFSSDPIAIKRSLASNSRLVHSSMMYRRESAKVFHGYDEKFDYAQDFALWLSLSYLGKLTVVPEQLTNLRRLTNSMTLGKDYSMNMVSDGYVLYRRAQGLEGLRVIDRLKGMRTIGLYGLLYAWRSLRAGNVVRAIGLIITNFWAIPLAIIELLRKSLKSFKTVK
jgi:hypothetical protein